MVSSYFQLAFVFQISAHPKLISLSKSNSNPTLYPTNEPSFSKSPTDSPSFSPTAFPTTPFPTLRPTITFSPTETISGSPTASPTKSPSGRPSSYPTSEPSDTPTGIPTITPYLTEDTTDDSGDPVRSSKCQVAPSRLQFVHKVTYTYNYEVYAPTTVDPISTIENLLSDQIHDEVARNFFQCKFEGDDLWILQSEPHALSPDRCRGAFPPNEQCFVVIATDRIWVFDDPNGRLLQQQNSNAAVAFATDINSFLNNAMLDGVFSGPDDISQIIYFNDGANPIVTKSPTPGPSLPPNESSPTIVDGGEKDSQTLEADSEKEEDGLSTRVIIGLVLAVGAVFVLIILCMLITRGKTRQRQLDYLEKADLDLVQQNTSIEEHLDMGSMPGVVEVSLLDDDLYSSSSPTRRSERAPLHAMDELDQAVGNHRGGKKKGKSSPGKRRYQSSDTVDL